MTSVASRVREGSRQEALFRLPSPDSRHIASDLVLGHDSNGRRVTVSPTQSALLELDIPPSDALTGRSPSSDLLACWARTPTPLVVVSSDSRLLQKFGGNRPGSTLSSLSFDPARPGDVRWSPFDCLRSQGLRRLRAERRTDLDPLGLVIDRVSAVIVATTHSADLTKRLVGRSPESATFPVSADSRLGAGKVLAQAVIQVFAGQCPDDPSFAAEVLEVLRERAAIGAELAFVAAKAVLSPSGGSDLPPVDIEQLVSKPSTLLVRMPKAPDVDAHSALAVLLSEVASRGSSPAPVTIVMDRVLSSGTTAVAGHFAALQSRGVVMVATAAATGRHVDPRDEGKFPFLLANLGSSHRLAPLSDSRAVSVISLVDAIQPHWRLADVSTEFTAPRRSPRLDEGAHLY